MDRGRITASPRACNRRQVVAKKRQRVVVKKQRRGSGDGFVNIVKKPQSREICVKTDRGFRMFDAQERFRNIRLQILAGNEDEEEDNGGGSSPFCFINKKDVKNI
ncbi:hypothetical protein Hdeb2414_s0024g00649421 [Helianthus debilis subsp. tardiflorus]